MTRNSEKQTHCRTYSCRPAPGLTSKEFVSTSSRCISSTEQETTDNIALNQAIHTKSNVAILPMLVSRDPLTTNHVAPHRRCGTLFSYKYVTSSVFKIFLTYRLHCYSVADFFFVDFCNKSNPNYSFERLCVKRLSNYSALQESGVFC